MDAASAGTGIATAPGWRLGRALRALHASSQAAPLREEMNTLEAPAWRKLWIFLSVSREFFSFLVRKYCAQLERIRGKYAGGGRGEIERTLMRRADQDRGSRR